MPKFQKGQPRPKNSGRKPGSINKITRSVKEAFEAAFKELQTNPETELTSWATKNQTNLREFYKIAARFIPAELSVDLQAEVTTQNIPDHLGPLPAGRTLEAERAWFAAFDRDQRMERMRRLLFSMMQPAYELESLWNVPGAHSAVSALVRSFAERMEAIVEGKHPASLQAKPAALPAPAECEISPRAEPEPRKQREIEPIPNSDGDWEVIE